MDGFAQTVARGDGVAGELALRRRHTAERVVHELIANGTFLMDTAETSSEELLADCLLSRHQRPDRVLVGGLGFGYTVAALLRDPRVRRVDVVELEPLLVQWLGDGLVPGVALTLADPRVHVTVADVQQVLATAAPAGYDGILLDVDNGPDFLVRPDNAAVYGPTALTAAARALSPGGVLAVWSADPSPKLAERLATHVGVAEDVVHTVEREGRVIDYHVYLARRATP